jgi:hypothetical protein
LSLVISSSSLDNLPVTLFPLVISLMREAWLSRELIFRIEFVSLLLIIFRVFCSTFSTLLLIPESFCHHTSSYVSSLTLVPSSLESHSTPSHHDFNSYNYSFIFCLVEFLVHRLFVTLICI